VALLQECVALAFVHGREKTVQRENVCLFSFGFMLELYNISLGKD